MEFRRVEKQDFPHVLALHKQMGLQYALELDDTFVIRNALLNGNAEPVAVVLGRLTAEAYLLLNRDWRTPEDRWEAIQRLSWLSIQQARNLGIGEVHAFLPPQLERSFGRRLYRQGFSKALWPCFFKEI